MLDASVHMQLQAIKTVQLLLITLLLITSFTQCSMLQGPHDSFRWSAGLYLLKFHTLVSFCGACRLMPHFDTHLTCYAQDKFKVHICGSAGLWFCSTEMVLMPVIVMAKHCTMLGCHRERWFILSKTGTAPQRQHKRRNAIKFRFG